MSILLGEGCLSFRKKLIESSTIQLSRYEFFGREKEQFFLDVPLTKKCLFFVGFVQL
jgi:hypothetical protein